MNVSPQKTLTSILTRGTGRGSYVLKLAGLLALTTIVFAPTIVNHFIAWDDQQEIYANAHFDSLSWHWTHTQESVWMPLTYYAWGGIAALSQQAPDGDGIRLDPAPFHAASVLSHAVAVAMVFLILRRLTGREWAAFFGGAVFAVHPLQVESVAWASELTTALSGALFFAALDQYLRCVDAEGRRKWIFGAVATVFYILSLLTKPTAMVLPAMVLVIHVLLVRRRWIRLATILGIWIPLAVADFLIARHFQPAEQVPSLPLVQRLIVAGDAVAFYLGKLVWPFSVLPDYGRMPQTVLAGHSLLWIVALVLVVVAIFSIRRAPRFATAAAIFLLGVGPLLGLVKFDYQFYSTVADRYVYLSMFGVGLFVAALLSPSGVTPSSSTLGEGWGEGSRGGVALANRDRSSNPSPTPLPEYQARVRSAALAFVLPFVCIAALAVLSFIQVQRWRDTRTLFEYNASIRPGSYISNKVLGLEFSQSDPTRAAEHFRAALAVHSDDAVVHYNYGNLLAGQKELPQAIEQWEQAVRCKPDHYRALNNLGVAAQRNRQIDLARDYYEQSIRASEQANEPFADPHRNLGLLLLAEGRDQDAVAQFEAALHINPDLLGVQRALEMARKNTRSVP